MNNISFIVLLSLFHSCWIKNDIAFYVAVVAYFCVIFLFNLVMFVVVLVQLCRIKRQNPHNLQHRTTLQDVRSVMGITILLGLTWGFAFFAWGPLNLPFMYLFAIFNSLQGKFFSWTTCVLWLITLTIMPPLLQLFLFPPLEVSSYLFSTVRWKKM